MADKIADAVVGFGVDTAALQQGLEKAQGMIQGAMGKIARLLGPAALAYATKKAFSNYVASADALGKFADSIGENVSKIDAWGLAVRQAGGTAEGFRSSVDLLAKGLNQVATTGKGRAKIALDAFGISAKDATGKTKLATELLMELAGKAETMSKEQFRGLAQTFGLDKGTIMLLQQGKRGVQELVKEMEGMAITKEDAEITARFNTAWQNLSTNLQRVAAMFFRLVTPALTKFTKVMTVAVQFLRDNENFTIAFFTGLAAVIMRKVVPAFLRWAVVVLINPLTWIVVAIIAGLALIALIVDDIITTFKGGDSVIRRIYELFRRIFEDITWDNLKIEFKAIGTAFKDLWAELKAMAGRIVDWIGEKVARVLNFIKYIIDEVRKAIDYIANSKLGQAVGAVGGAAKKAWGFVMGNQDTTKGLAPALSLNNGLGRTEQNISADNNVSVDTVIINGVAANSVGAIAGGFAGAVANEIPKRLTNRAGAALKAY